MLGDIHTECLCYTLMQSDLSVDVLEEDLGVDDMTHKIGTYFDDRVFRC